ncbi:Arc family DNA-binding protein [Shinella zoogloeoides]|uniref:Arc family DNA-binding protein n=1 Tax=Shinella zoogloeoides TaxID=352475 RepID=UPI0028A5FF8B|nr:Arc family DNA-binding protein [Shinella zoogloeoides]
MTHTRPSAPTSVRIPADLKGWLEDRSIKNFRSMNAELVAILSALRKGEEDDPEGFAKFGVTYR